MFWKRGKAQASDNRRCPARCCIRVGWPVAEGGYDMDTGEEEGTMFRCGGNEEGIKNKQ